MVEVISEHRARSLALVVILATLLVGISAGFAGLAGAQENPGDSGSSVVRGEPDVSVHLPSNVVEPGNVTALELQVGNEAEVTAGTGSATVTTARSTTVEVTDDGPFEVKTAKTAIGSVPDGEVVPVPLEVEVPEDVEPGAYEMEVEVSYGYSDSVGSYSGESRESETETKDVTVVVDDDSQFEITDVEDTLSVGYEGEVTGTIEHAGNETVDDAVLIVEPMSESLHVEDTRYALPAIEPNGSADFRYPMDVSGSADGGPRQVQFTVEYTDSIGAPARSDRLSERVTVDERTDAFSIDAGDGVSVEAGGNSEVTLELTNERPEPLTNIDARLYDEDPITATDDEAFVPELEPGESAEITFAVGAAEGASTETHPVDLDFEYENERGDTILTDRYRQGIDVEPASDDGDGGSGGTIVGVVAVLSIAIAGVTMWWIRR